MPNLATQFYNFMNPHAQILPTSETQTPPSGESNADALPPIKNWSHPFKDQRDPFAQLTHLANAAGGGYPLGGNGLWHGGVHFDSGTTGAFDQSSVHCIADGEVVAYRIDEQSPTTAYLVHKLAVNKSFSRNFVLVRHRLQPPKVDGSPDAPPSLVFYSLYMHLQDWAVYQADAKFARPGFWAVGPSLQVKDDVNDLHVDRPGQKGLIVRNQPSKGKLIGWLPRGAEVTVTGEGDFRKLENSLGPSRLIAADGSLMGYVSADYLRPIANGQHRIECVNTLNVRAQGHLLGHKLFELAAGTEVTVSGQGAFRKLERVNQYIHYPSLRNGASEPKTCGSVVVLDKTVAIKAGDLIGHVGEYHDSNAQRPENQLHLEVFSGDDVEMFIKLSQLWANKLPASDKSLLKLAKGTAVVTHQAGFNSKQPPTLNAPSIPTDAQLLVPKSLLDRLPIDRKISIAASGENKACNWYRLEGLLHDDTHTLLDGWVCEEVGVTPWVSPWSWEGYEALFNYDSPRRMMASFSRAARRINDQQLPRWSGIADSVDQGPIKTRLYDIIDRNRDGQITANELQAALRLPAHAQSLSQLIVHYESEWHHTQHKWDDLDDLLGHSDSTPNQNWLAEKERIKQMSWWGEVASQVGLPAHGKVYHMHPIAFGGQLFNKTRRITVELLEKVTGKSGKWFTGRGGGRTFANDFSANYPKVFEFDKYRFVDQLNDALDRYGITTPYQKAHFVAQCFHESAAFETTVEFGSGAQYDPGQHSSAIANGNTEIGDGPRYKGRGLLQLTWKNNYAAYSRYRGFDFVASPTLVASDMSNAIDVSCWYWRHRGAVSQKYGARGDINILVDNEPNNVKLVTLAVNGGSNGLQERTEIYEAIRNEWSLR
ncbi:glycoside hydrolase family 19 protein [Pseudomonas abietaniphila]|jgi:predicted chitinase